MKTFGLFTKNLEPDTLEHARGIVSFLTTRGAQVIAEQSLAKELLLPELRNQDLPSLYCILSLGGDGTILRFHRRFPTSTVPLIGINIGSLGFLADIPLSSCFESLEKLLEGRFRVEPRLVLEGVLRNGVMTAVNEFTIHRASSPFIVDISITLDGRYFNTFSGDGVIISTPLGSTAYSMAAGGPILDPDINALVITPICSHAISSKPVVVMPKQKIEIACTTRGARSEVIYDGIVGPILSPEDIFSISLSQQKFNMVRLEGTDFFSTLRSKMGWTGSLRK